MFYNGSRVGINEKLKKKTESSIVYNGLGVKNRFCYR